MSDEGGRTTARDCIAAAFVDPDSLEGRAGEAMIAWIASWLFLAIAWMLFNFPETDLGLGPSPGAWRPFAALAVIMALFGLVRYPPIRAAYLRAKRERESDE